MLSHMPRIHIIILRVSHKVLLITRKHIKMLIEDCYYLLFLNKIQVEQNIVM